MKSRRNFIKKTAIGALSVSGIGMISEQVTANEFNILDLGAKPDGEFLNTKILQQAIDACSKNGGGIVLIPPGQYLSGAIILKTGVTLYLEKNATLLGSTNRNDYLKNNSDNSSKMRLVYAYNQENIAIRGEGTIDGQGFAFVRQNSKKEKLPRPIVLHLEKCKNIKIEGIFLTNSGAWMQHYHECDNVQIRGVRVFNHCNYGNDGIDVNSCHDVIISDCIIDSDDDGICIKSTSPRLSRNILVNNCLVSSFCNALKLGTESSGGFKNIHFSNCTITPCEKQKRYYGHDLGTSAIAIETVDGGNLEQVTVDNITIEDTGCPIFIRLGNRAREYDINAPEPGIGILKNVRISNIMATTTSHVASSITGLIGSYAENIHIENVIMTINNKREAADSNISVRENDRGYPHPRMFGENLPASAFFVRHVKNIRFFNTHLSIGKDNPLPVFVFNDVKNGKIFFTELGKVDGNELLKKSSDCEGIEVV